LAISKIWYNDGVKSIDYRTTDEFLRNRLFMPAVHDFPFVYSQNVELDSIEYIGFDKTHIIELLPSNKRKTVHFFLDDYKFDEVWNSPEKQMKKLSQYAQVLGPDFSLYTDMPEALQIYNIFRSRWCAANWQFNGLAVIPTITWGDQNTFNFCFDGVEKGCTVAISTVGTLHVKDKFMAGFKAMCDIIEPKTVLNYGQTHKEMEQLANIITVPYHRMTSDYKDSIDEEDE
jgi:hypothetical protein